MYSVYTFALVCWVGVLYSFFVVSPTSYSNIFAFLILLFLAVGFAVSLPLYKRLTKKNPGFSNQNILYKKALKQGLFISFGITGVLLLRAFKLVSLLNIGLFALLYLGIFYQIRDRR